MGIRLEYKPSFVPGLNVGFVLNQPDMKQIAPKDQTFTYILQESVIGAAYENEYFAVRVGYRFDGPADTYTNDADEGGRLTYRLEGRFLGTLVDGMQVWLNGDYYGIGNERRIITINVNGVPTKLEFGAGEYLINWLYWLLDTDSFIAKFDTCFSMYQTYSNAEFTPRERQEYMSLEVKPAFYYKLFDNLLQAGLRLGFGMEFGEGKTYKDSPYQYYFVEPQVRFNIGSNSYLALVYNFTDKYVWPGVDVVIPKKMPYQTQPGDKYQKNSIKLRAVYTFWRRGEPHEKNNYIVTRGCGRIRFCAEHRDIRGIKNRFLHHAKGRRW
jgi:hypothetical protein